MRYELELIKKKTIIATKHTRNKKAMMCLLSIIRLSEACLETVDSMDSNITNLALNMRRATTDIDQKVRYPSGQREQTVNLLASAYVGSNPSLTTRKKGM